MKQDKTQRKAQIRTIAAMLEREEYGEIPGTSNKENLRT